MRRGNNVIVMQNYWHHCFIALFTSGAPFNAVSCLVTRLWTRIQHHSNNKISLSTPEDGDPTCPQGPAPLLDHPHGEQKLTKQQHFSYCKGSEGICLLIFYQMCHLRQRWCDCISAWTPDLCWAGLPGTHAQEGKRNPFKSIFACCPFDCWGVGCSSPFPWKQSCCFTPPIKLLVW